MASAHVSPTQQQQPLPWPHGGGVHVLVVNDYADNVESMAMLLRLYGHEVQTALGGPAALRAARANPPEVVLLDISMLGMDGYEVARQLRRMFQGRVVLIALTALGFEEDKRRCEEAGFDRHLVKPADPEKVEQLLRELACSL
jgi:CheY-like chemotaxis protein